MVEKAFSQNKKVYIKLLDGNGGKSGNERGDGKCLLAVQSQKSCLLDCKCISHDNRRIAASSLILYYLATNVLEHLHLLVVSYSYKYKLCSRLK